MPIPVHFMFKILIIGCQLTSLSLSSYLVPVLHLSWIKLEPQQLLLFRLSSFQLSLPLGKVVPHQNWV